MAKVLFFVLTVLISIIFAGFYGIVHDQLTYSISPEYYTKFKFVQFGFDEMGIAQNIGTENEPEFLVSNPRAGAAFVGFLATWWMGFPIGTIIGIIAVLNHERNHLRKVIFSSILITLVVAFLTGIVGLMIGKLFLSNTELNWSIPQNVIDKSRFICVGSMHNFSYVGGLTGLIAAIIYQFITKRRLAYQQ